jgi:thiamine-monophosphate kinase
MMDLSDGLGVDLPRLALASRLGYSIAREKLPLSPGCTVENALSDGEDYELLFAVAPRQGKELEKRWRKKFPKVPLTRIGRLNSKLQHGYLHFQ